MAIEINSTNFNVGLFTYCLTQSLWENLPLTDNLSLMKKVASQITLYTGKSETFNFYGDLKNSILPYHLSLDSFSQGNAIITNIIEPNIIELELLSLPLLVLLNYGLNSCFIANLGEEKKVTIQINSLVGNKAKGILINSNKNLVYKGLILRESLRIIKRNTTLNIALNDSLEKIEKVDATSALSAISEIESVVNLGDNFADLVFGKVNDKKTMIDGYGLFTSSEVLLVNTYPKVDNEAVSSAIKHLIPSLKIALAEKLLQLTSNQYSSLLSVNINVEISHNDKIINIQEQTSYSNYQPIKNPFQKYSNNDQNLLIEIPFDSQLTITINNENNHNLYYLLVGINSSRQAISYFSPDEIIINSLDNITIPKHKSSLKWSMNTDKAISKLMLICSKSPFNQTLNQLYKNPNLKPDIEQIILLDNPVIIAKAILEDLHLGSNISNNIINNLNDVYALDLSHWVTFNLTYKVV